MPTGTGAPISLNLPSERFKIDPAAFADFTDGRVYSPFSFDDPGSAGGSVRRELPREGILAWATITAHGTLTTVDGTGAVATKDRWPYGLLESVEFGANAQTGLIQATGEALHVRRLVANPAYEDNTDDFAGTVGGGDTNLGDLTDDPFHLTWQVPVSMERTTLTGAVYAQSGRSNLTLKVNRRANADLFTLTGTATAAFDVEFTVTVHSYKVPTDPDGSLIIPDLSRFHGFQEQPLPITNTGETALPLVQTNGQLLRLYVQLRKSATAIIDPKPSVSEWEALRLKYGGNEIARDWDPIWPLLALNNEHYGTRLPYGFVVLDFQRENSRRDAVIMQGLTDLRASVDILGSVTITEGSAYIVQETLFQ